MARLIFFRPKKLIFIDFSFNLMLLVTSVPFIIPIKGHKNTNQNTAKSKTIPKKYNKTSLKYKKIITKKKRFIKTQKQNKKLALRWFQVTTNEIKQKNITFFLLDSIFLLHCYSLPTIASVA